ncbi:MAG: hypothetical protein ACREX4_10430 [Gammaproteobacteria bacterium]
MYRRLLSPVLGFTLTLIAGSAYAGGCDPYKKECPPPEPPKARLCHNIGGPQELGANCDNANFDEFPCLLITNSLVYAGILIDPNDSSFEAHLKHGDGSALMEFDPPLHLASEIGPHQASNVECVAVRELTEQPPEPGN